MKLTTDVEIEYQLLNKVADLLTHPDNLFNTRLASQQVIEDEQLELAANNLPSLKAGAYSFHVKQELKKTKTDKGADNVIQLEKQSDTFIIASPKQALNPNDIHQVFPPKGMFGDYARFLPHIVLNRSTLPWEANHSVNTAPGSVNTSWLALVVLTEEEIEKKKIEEGLTRIKINKALIPCSCDLDYLAHVKKSPQRDAKAVIIANRLPLSGETNIVHLIALDAAPEDGFYTSLYHWSFTCDHSKEKSLEGIVGNLKSGLFRLPNSTDIGLNKCLEQGYTPLPHFARNGQRILSWYRGPFRSSREIFEENPSTRDHISNSDQLLRYFKTSNRLDTSYAAAWALGKWLTLNHKEIAIEIYNWKKKFAINFKSKRTQFQLHSGESIESNSLSDIASTIEEIFGKSPAELEMPKAVQDWFFELRWLRPIPFAYLLPDERLLPPESIRFFHLDDRWIWSLIDGALSVGRLPTEGEEINFTPGAFPYSGCIIRSELILNYPDLDIRADNNQVPIERRKIGKDILLLLFKNTSQTTNSLKKINFFLKPTGMHFGIGEKDKKKFTNPSEKKDPKPSVDVRFKGEDYLRILNIQYLVAEIKIQFPKEPCNSAQFAYRMIEGASKVEFCEMEE